jgi:hypothetical protein
MYRSCQKESSPLTSTKITLMTKNSINLSKALFPAFTRQINSYEKTADRSLYCGGLR